MGHVVSLSGSSVNCYKCLSALEISIGNRVVKIKIIMRFYFCKRCAKLMGSKIDGPCGPADAHAADRVSQRVQFWSNHAPANQNGSIDRVIMLG